MAGRGRDNSMDAHSGTTVVRILFGNYNLHPSELEGLPVLKVERKPFFQEFEFIYWQGFIHRAEKIAYERFDVEIYDLPVGSRL